MIQMKKAHKAINVEALDKDMQLNVQHSEHLKWYDPRKSPFQMSGFGWSDPKQDYRRLPTKQLKSGIPDAVDQLAECTSGGQIRFQTNASTLSIKVELPGKANMNHMSAMGQCGFDCYLGEPGEQRFHSAVRYKHTEQAYEFIFFEREKTNNLTVTLNFPLYQGVHSVLIGVDLAANISTPPVYQSDEKVIFYGTSITQGGCASRAGMSYTNILSRRFNQEFINLGFSGNGKGEGYMAQLLSEIENPACLVLDYEPNCVSTEMYFRTLPKFIETYRGVHPTTPILVISQFPYAVEKVDEKVKTERLRRLDFQSQLIKQLRENGDQHIYFQAGTTILGDYLEEGTVDGIHPNDLGFMAMADSLTPVLKEILD